MTTECLFKKIRKLENENEILKDMCEGLGADAEALKNLKKEYQAILYELSEIKNEMEIIQFAFNVLARDIEKGNICSKKDIRHSYIQKTMQIQTLLKKAGINISLYEIFNLLNRDC